MSLSPAPIFPERGPQAFDRAMAPNIGGQKGPLRFEEGVETDTDVPHDFARGYSEGAPYPGRPNHNNPAVQFKHAEETMRERAHVGSASWIDAQSMLREFADGSFAGYGDPSFELIVNNGLRQQRRSAVVISD